MRRARTITRIAAALVMAWQAQTTHAQSSVQLYGLVDAWMGSSKPLGVFDNTVASNVSNKNGLNAPEGGAGVGTLALLQQDQGDEQRRDDDQGDGKEAIQHGDDSMGLSFGYREAAAQMAWNSAASSDAPPTNPPSMSGMLTTLVR